MADVAVGMVCTACGTAMMVTGGYGDEYLEGACSRCGTTHSMVAPGGAAAGLIGVGPAPATAVVSGVTPPAPHEPFLGTYETPAEDEDLVGERKPDETLPSWWPKESSAIEQPKALEPSDNDEDAHLSSSYEPSAPPYKTPPGPDEPVTPYGTPPEPDETVTVEHSDAVAINDVTSPRSGY